MAVEAGARLGAGRDVRPWLYRRAAGGAGTPAAWTKATTSTRSSAARTSEAATTAAKAATTKAAARSATAAKAPVAPKPKPPTTTAKATKRTTTAPAVRDFANCPELNQVYPHGVGKPGAVDKTSDTPVTNYLADSALYAANSGARPRR